MKNEAYNWDLQELFPSQLLVDQRYQRKLNDNQVKKAIGEFNVNLVNCPKVNKRSDGKYYIMDGQHTLAIWKQKFGNRPIQCRVVTGLTWMEEAEVFLAQFGVFRTVTTKEKLNTRYNLKDPSVCKMVEVANNNGVGVMFYKTANENGKCYATDAMFDVFSKVGESTFSDILDVIMESWDGEKASLQSGFLKGLGKFYELYNGKFTKKALIDCMKTRNPEWFIREAKNIQSGNLATRYCKAFLKAYNMRKSVNKLPDVV